jgi:hypothetical protein
VSPSSRFRQLGLFDVGAGLGLAREPAERLLTTVEPARPAPAPGPRPRQATPLVDVTTSVVCPV